MELRGLYHFLLIITVAGLASIPREGMSQCSVWFHTFPYFCDDDSVLVQAIPVTGTPPFTYIWETGDTGEFIVVPNVLGDYMLTMTDATGCTVSTNAHIKQWPIVHYPYTDYACEGDSVLLYLDWVREDLPGLIYEWSTGQTGSQIFVYEEMTWQVTVTDPATGCEFISEPQTLQLDEKPDPEIIGPTEICNGQSVTLSLEGGPFTFITWHPSYTYDETLVVTEPGMYWVYVTFDNSWCAGTDTIIITEGNINEPILSGPPELCDGLTGTISVTNENLFEEFLWSTGENTSSIDVEGPGTYIVTVTDEGGCSATESITVEDASQNELSADVTASTCGESNGSIDLTMSEPGNYSFEWSNGATSEDLADLNAGNYSVTVTDDNGCTSTLDTDVPDESISITINEIISDNNSCSSPNGAIDLTIQPDQSYAIQWSNGASTEDVANLSPGSYSVTVTHGVNCTESQTFTVNDISAAPDLEASTIASTCGEANGSAELQITGGNAPFNFIWSNGSTSQNIYDLNSGNYYVTVTASDGCTSTLDVIIPDQTISISVQESITPNESCSAYNGSIDLTITPVVDYLFGWSNGQTTEDLYNLSPGTYSVTITHGANCIATETYIVNDLSAAPDLQAVSIPASCGQSNGSIDLQLTGGNAPFSYEWSNGQNTEDLVNVGSGTYTVTVTASDGCMSTMAIDVADQTPAITIDAQTQPNTSCSINNGAIDLSVTPGGNYIYQWSNGAITEDISNVGAGNYTVNITLNGCNWSDTFVVANENLPFSVSGTAEPNTSCIAGNGSIDISISSAGTYTYLWSNGSTLEDQQDLLAGSYTVVVSDNFGCSITSNFIVSDSITPFSVSGLSVDNTSCQVPNGSINVTTTPAGTYTYLWSTGATTEDLQLIGGGTFNVTITNEQGCSIDTSFTVNEQSGQFVLNAASTPDTSCAGGTGSIDLSITPAGNYTFNWSGGQNTEDLTNLEAGTYAVTVTNTDNCSSNASFDIENLTSDPVLTSTVKPSSCGKPNGSILLSVLPAGGNVFLWSNGASAKDLADIAAGNYSVTVTAANGCSATSDFIVPDQNSNLQISGLATNNQSCLIANGTIDITIEPANGAYVYQWSNGSTTQDLQTLSAGDYILTVTDAFSCTFSESFTIQDNLVIPILNSIVTPANCGQANGAINIEVSATSNNNFLWSGGQATEDLNLIIPGTYQVTVTSEHGCSAVLAVEVPNQNSSFALEVQQTDNYSCTTATGGIDLTVTPSGIYHFAWSNGATTEDLLQLASGIYTVTVTDAFNCATSELIVIEDVISPPSISAEVFDASCGIANGRIDLEVTPDSPLNQFVWSTGASIEDIADLPEGSYSVTVTDENGCTIDGAFDVSDSPLLEVAILPDLNSVPVGGNVICSLQLNVPLDNIDSIAWSPHHLLSCHDPLCLEQIITLTEPAEISVIVTDQNGCSGQAILMLLVESSVNVYIPNIFTPDLDGVNDHFTVFAKDIEEVELLEIFDRWGNCVFIKNNFPPNERDYGWDGMYSGTPMNPDVFAYRAVLRDFNGEVTYYKGDVTLVR